MHEHVAHKVGAVLKTLLADGTLEWTFAAVRSLVMLQVR